MWDGHLGRTTMTKRRIELSQPNAAPVHPTPYLTGPKTRALEKAQIEKMLAENVIKIVRTDWVALIIFVPNKDVTLQFCVDFHNFNAVSRRDYYAITQMKECLDLPGKVTVFSILDADSRYCQSRSTMQEKKGPR